MPLRVWPDHNPYFPATSPISFWLPTHGSWLNQVEIWFSLLSRKCLRRASVRSTQDLRALIQRFIKTWNTPFAHPFEWTYTGKPLAVAPQHYELLAA